MALRAALITALSALALGELAKPLANIEDDPDKLATALAGQVKSEIETRTAANPLLSALAAANITDEKSLKDTFQAADHGRKFVSKLRLDAKAEGIRALGADSAKDIDEMIEHMPIDLLEKQKTRWKADADKEFGTTEGQGAQRQTAPAALPGAQSAPADGKQGKSWAERRKELMGHDKLGREILAKEGK